VCKGANEARLGHADVDEALLAGFQIALIPDFARLQEMTLGSSNQGMDRRAPCLSLALRTHWKSARLRLPFLGSNALTRCPSERFLRHGLWEGKDRNSLAGSELVPVTSDRARHVQGGADLDNLERRDPKLNANLTQRLRPDHLAKLFAADACHVSSWIQWMRSRRRAGVRI
jgi:hypothetical protein